ncbi:MULTISPECIES: polyprenyl synthetase family protein [Bacillota]|jgi:geranylgeranyl diphosphate synthase, type II|uniref:Farnesyl diphosphate synthase n=2 Tax=Amedibacillus TaxID=2749846 RepID=A0A7G9GMI4_9FIRM|nr:MULTISPECIES: farnesyl diphosphate synthase [Bacillota]QNM12016.1 polyprenyl synthetase family protein [[Eubacterium] hominis]MCH4286634.1 polyprenyl synthetase family protein [Amedibacillus hominis]RGB53083.1 polyprenyl synthetase family protein [Absiella sp. AM22-9]RGB59374.1 polyprenyl synthetase family protein [Absiella sp. AM10-20]RGB66655.1 polyprenyl synthetase family protein [Absiella sp. AM09-45]
MNNFEEYLLHTLDGVQDSKVKEAMKYSLMAGGKRIRPRLLFAVLSAYGVREEAGYPVAAAIEMIHTYSLIHDDLPAMDNDTLRRGKPTCHVQFDEATAILAGDALLTQAFIIASEVDTTSALKADILRALAQYSGADGMILGQIKDIEGEAKASVTLEELLDIFEYKTGKLLTLPMVCACFIAERKGDISVWKKIGRAIGLSFQIQDDILDVTSTKEELGKNIHSDLSNDKTTYVSLRGVEGAQVDAQKYYDEAMAELKSLTVHDEKVTELLQLLINRKH